MTRTCRALAVAVALGGLTQAAMAEDPRARRGQEVVDQLSGGAGQPVLSDLQQDFPPLGDAVLKYALGDIVGRTVLDARTRQIATVAMLAAGGHLPQLKIHAGYALNLGVPPEELNEIVYLTTVYAGFPRALNVASTLRELFAERGIQLPVDAG
jgi:4-carboxymuconolactone decarboxylase